MMGGDSLNVPQYLLIWTVLHVYPSSFLSPLLYCTYPALDFSLCDSLVLRWVGGWSLPGLTDSLELCAEGREDCQGGGHRTSGS